jgi:hypothetical protein
MPLDGPNVQEMPLSTPTYSTMDDPVAVGLRRVYLPSLVLADSDNLGQCICLVEFILLIREISLTSSTLVLCFTSRSIFLHTGIQRYSRGRDYGQTQ